MAALCLNTSTQSENSLESLNFLLSRNQTNTKRSRKVFYNLAEFPFEYFCDSRRILATFAKFFFSNRISHTCHPARDRAPLHLPHMFFDTTNLYKPLPRFAVFLARTKSLDLRTGMKCRELIPEAFLRDSAITTKSRGRILQRFVGDGR